MGIEGSSTHEVVKQKENPTGNTPEYVNALKTQRLVEVQSEEKQSRKEDARECAENLSLMYSDIITGNERDLDFSKCSDQQITDTILNLSEATEALLLSSKRGTLNESNAMY